MQLFWLGAIILVVAIGVFFYNRPTDRKIFELKEKLILIDPKLAEIPMREGDSSYTLNDKYVVLCLKDRRGYYYDDNTLVYVALHEIAHTLDSCRDKGGKSDKSGRDSDHTESGPDKDHCDSYIYTFQRLLARAEEVGVYDPTLPIPDDYCT